MFVPTAMPESAYATIRSARRFPSASASSDVSSRAPGRYPVQLSSSRRSSVTATGAVAAIESATAAAVSAVNDSFAPNPPPMCSAMPWTLSRGSLKRSAICFVTCPSACVDR
jgi:hypothetical protein